MQRIYSVDENKGSNFHGLQEQHKQLETIEMAILGLIFMIKNMCINSKLDPLTKFTTTSSRVISFTDIRPWNISLMITKIVSINRRIITICTIKRSIPFESEGKPMKTEPKNLITIS